MRRLVYLAGPIGANDGGRTQRIVNAIKAADDLWAAGFYAFVPHLCHWWDAHTPRGYEQWMDYDAAWLATCDALYRMPGESPGADREMKVAAALGMPVFTDLDSLRSWARGESK